MFEFRLVPRFLSSCIAGTALLPLIPCTQARAQGLTTYYESGPALASFPHGHADLSLAPPAGRGTAGTGSGTGRDARRIVLAEEGNAVAPNAARKSFATGFSTDEDPISESGAWRHLGSYWARVRIIGRHAVGTQTGKGGYDDSYAYLSGFGPNQMAAATLWIDPATTGNFREVELLLRWADSTGMARGYECNLAWDGSYAEIVRWNGRYGDFTYIARETRFARGVMPPRTGDVLTAAIHGNSIQLFLDKNDGQGGRLLVRGSDEHFSDGNPGIGFFINGGVSPDMFGFSSFTATDE